MSQPVRVEAIVSPHLTKRGVAAVAYYEDGSSAWLDAEGQLHPMGARGGGVPRTAPAPTTAIARKPGCCGERGFLRKLAGGVRLAAQSLGMLGEAPEPERAQRQAACLCCPSYDFGTCTDCGCFLWAKVRIASEACPQGKWLACTVGGKAP